MRTMKEWIRNQFRDAKTSFATAMAIAGCVGVLCCACIIGIVLLAR